MERFIHDKTNGVDYEFVGDYYLPCLKAPKSPKQVVMIRLCKQIQPK